MPLPSNDIANELAQAVQAAYRAKSPLNITGGNTKSWYGRTPNGTPLAVNRHTGIIHYQPSELILTARAGTTLAEIADALDQHRQRLPFDPPHFGEQATLGGTVACNFSGPRRPYAGACRDFVLGCTMINGKGETMHFGGEVMKNVAGFDLSRLMSGSLGTLGLLLDISMKVLPHRVSEQTLTLEADYAEAIAIMNRRAATPLPVTAMLADGQRVYFRICGSPASVESCRKQIDGDLFEDGWNFWKELREQRLDFFDDPRPLWRLCVPQSAPHLQTEGEPHDWLIGWGGGLRWFKSERSFAEVQAMAKSMGGHASLFRNGHRDDEVFAPLAPPLLALHHRIKKAFDPAGILNPGRMYKDL